MDVSIIVEYTVIRQTPDYALCLQVQTQTAPISQLRQVNLSNFGTLSGGEIERFIESHKMMMTDK